MVSDATVVGNDEASKIPDTLLFIQEDG